MILLYAAVVTVSVIARPAQVPKIMLHLASPAYLGDVIEVAVRIPIQTPVSVVTNCSES